MPKLYVTERTYLILLVPFCYALFSRMSSLKSILSNAATAWIPGAILALYYRDGGVIAPLAGFIASYYAFICIYEIGYLVNDTHGLKGDETPRRRIVLDYRSSFYVLFYLIRITAFISLSWVMHWWTEPLWYAGFGALIVLIWLHNTVARVELKMVTFFQLSLLRFVTPVALTVGREHVFDVLVIGVFYYLYIRFIVYLTSKARLSLPERQNIDYLPSVYGLFLPMAALLSFASQDYIFLGMNLYYLFVFLMFGVVGDRIRKFG